MKKIYTLFMVSAIALTTNAQMVFNENFGGYTVNTGLTGQGGWANGGSSGTDVQVKNTTPLSYSGYTSGNEYVTTASSSGIDPEKGYLGGTTISTSTNRNIFMSFVIRVNSVSASGNPGVGFQSVALQNTSNTNYPARFYIDRNSANTAVRFGIAVGNESPAYTSFSYSFNTTYLIVIRYDVVSGNNNDNAYLWVNPSLAAEPTTASANASHVSSNGEVGYGTSLNSLKLFQTSGAYTTANADFDAFRIASNTTSAAAWIDLAPQGAPLPVQLTSFNASQDGMTTKLVWNTAEESGITNYVVEKSTDGRTFTDIGSVAAANQKTYNFTDAQPASDYIYYRLKIVEMDGTYKLSYIVSLKSKLSLNITLSPNPVRNVLMIQHPKVATDGHIQIVSADGRLIKDLRLPANAVISNVDMSGFASGLYHVVFKSGTDVFSKTVLKQ